MKSKLLATVVVLCLSAGALAKNEYAGGSGDAVKAWKPIPFESFKTGLMPMIIYIYDSSMKTNVMAKDIETALKLDDFKDKLTKFSKTRIKADGSDAKGWEPMLPDAKGGVRLIIMTSGEKPYQIVFDKNTPGGTKAHNKDSILAAMNAVLEMEAKNKADELKKEKAVEAAEAKVEKAKEEKQEVVKPIAGLEVKEPKVEPKKVVPVKTEDKKPVAAKAEEKKIAEIKSDDPKVIEAKKKAVEAAKKVEDLHKAYLAAKEEQKKADAAVIAAAGAAKPEAKAEDKKPGDTAKADDPKDPKMKKKGAEDE